MQKLLTKVNLIKLPHQTVWRLVFLLPPAVYPVVFCSALSSIPPPTPTAVSMGGDGGDITPTSYTWGSREVHHYQATVVITAIIWNYNRAIRLMENVPISPDVLQRDAPHTPRAPPPPRDDAGDVKWRGGNGGKPLILTATCYMAPWRTGRVAEGFIWGEITPTSRLSAIWIRVFFQSRAT